MITQPLETPMESQLCTNASFRSVVDVAGKDYERGVTLNSEIDEGVEGVERSVSQSFPHPWCDLPDPTERRVQVEIRRMHEAELQASPPT